MHKPPSILLYRFMGASRALESIQKRRFKVGRVREFNDPFEWTLAMEGYRPEGESVADSVVEHLVDHAHSNYGIICFSSTASEPVLWGHYGEKHKGVAFEVDYLVEPDKLIRMTYSEKRPIMDVNRLKDPAINEYLIPIFKQILFQKSPGWAYEQEYRAYERLRDCEAEDGNYFKRIPDDFLARVILGFQCDLKEDEVQKALQTVGLKDTKVSRARMDRHTYAITWDRN
jgi:hypothetical protein